MNLILRMLFVLVRAHFMARMETDNLTSTLTLRVLPNDIDINFHMNNGRYLTICDLNRVDVFARSGLLRSMYRRGWIPVIAEHTMVYKKPLNLFQRYEVKLDVLSWDDRFFYMSHTFSCGERVMATGTSKGCVYARGIGVVSPASAFNAVEEDRSK